MKLGITGCTGRVGSLLVQELTSGQYEDMELAGGTARRKGSVHGVTIMDADALFQESDCVIDFTTPDATANHAALAKKHGTKLVIGTTGLSRDQESAIHDAAKKTAIVYAANMSIGINLLLALVKQAAQRLGDDFDIEIFEAHHRNKVDAPSGTALALGRAAAEGRGNNLDDIADYARHGQTGTREDGKIGFSVLRGGDIVGDHSVNFCGMGERLELTHKAYDRSIYAKGALRAAAWLRDKDAGLFTMADVLEL